ncbi:MAG: hypothetical protein AAF790_13955 [Planctomycetota bacterium]
MRRYPASWSTVLAQLGFKAKRRPRRNTHGRRAWIEPLEQRQLLAVDVFTVTTLADQHDGDATDGLSLREALAAADDGDAAGEVDRIVFDPSLFAAGPGTILLGDADGSGVIDGTESPDQPHCQYQLLCQR